MLNACPNIAEVTAIFSTTLTAEVQMILSRVYSKSGVIPEGADWGNVQICALFAL